MDAMDVAYKSVLYLEGILLTAYPHDYHCFLCEKDVTGIKCGIDHLKGRPHITQLEKFEKSFEMRGAIVICKICRFKGSWIMYAMHKSFHNSQPKKSNSTFMRNLIAGMNSIATIGNNQPTHMYEMLILNFISKHKDKYFCHLCYCIFSSWVHAYEHIAIKSHKATMAKVVSTFSPGFAKAELDILKSRTKELIENCIFLQKPDQYNCFTCGTFVSGINNLMKHINSSNHIKCKSIVKFKDKVTGQILQIRRVANSEIVTRPTRFKVPDQLKWMLTAHGIRVTESELYCPACDVVMNNNSAIETHLTTHLKMVWTNFKTSPPDSQLSLPDVQTTNQTENEKPTYLIPYICNLCDVKVSHEKILIEHFLGKKHRKYMAELFGTIENINQTKTDEAQENMNVIENVSYFCPGCNLKVNNVEALPKFKHNLETKIGHTWLVIPGSNAISKPAAKIVHGAAGNLEMELRTSAEVLSSKQDNRTQKARKPKTGISIDSVVSGSFTDKSSSPEDFVFTKDYIFDIDAAKLRKLKLSIQLSYVMNKENMYCLVCQAEVRNQLQNYYEHLCDIDHLENLAQMEKDDKEFEDYTDQFSDLNLAKECMQELNEKIVKCVACNVEIVNEDLQIFEHIALESHDLKRRQFNAVSDKIYEDILSESENMWYNVVHYECKLCNVKYNSEFDFGKHLDDKIHSHHCLQYLMSRLGELMYDSCIPCALLWYGNTLSYANHCKEMTHKYETKNNRYIVKDLPESVKYMLQNFNETVNDLAKLSNEIRRLEEKKEKVLLKDLERVIQLQIPTAKAYIFGSRAANLYSLKSDVDVYIDCGDMYNETNCSNTELQCLMKTLEQCLNSNQAIWLIESIVETGNPSCFILEHKPTRLKCNLTFASALSVVSTEVIKSFNDKYPTCRNLIIFLKKWLSACELLGSSYISSYTITWLLIFYLQNRLIFPSIACLIEIENKSRIIQGWETGVSSNFAINPSKLSLKELLIDFFQFYADHDYRHHVICPLLGTVIEKRTFLNPSNLPIHMKPYIDGVATRKNPYFRTDVPMCVQDPFLLSNNIAVKTKKLTLNRFRQLCTKSANLLKCT